MQECKLLIHEAMVVACCRAVEQSERGTVVSHFRNARWRDKCGNKLAFSLGAVTRFSSRRAGRYRRWRSRRRLRIRTYYIRSGVPHADGVCLVHRVVVRWGVGAARLSLRGFLTRRGD